MFIPLRTDRPPKRRPIVTEGLILVNLLVYLAAFVGETTGVVPSREAFLNWGHFNPQDFKIWQLFSYQFMHAMHSRGDIFHIVFNMLFLWVFGCAVESRLGRLGFLAFYLLGGAVSALAHMMVTDSPVIGASGAVAGVTGAFLALFPRSRIIVLIFFFIIGVYAIPALWFIGFYFLIDVLNQTTAMFGRGSGNVAYMAHIAGYAYGFGVAFALLATHVLKHEEFDVFFLFTQARRRAEFRAAGRGQTGGLWESASADTGAQLAKKKASDPVLDEAQRRFAEQRAEISRLIADHDLPAAAIVYRELLAEAPDMVLPEQQQLDLANQFYKDGDHPHAAAAYELFLDTYRSRPDSAEIRLILGLLYARRLSRPDRARELIEAAADTLRDASQRTLAQQLLTELST